MKPSIGQRRLAQILCQDVAVVIVAIAGMNWLDGT